MNEPVSPPSAKRRRRESDTGGAERPPPIAANRDAEHYLRLFSWNINGIANFLQPSIANYIKRGPAEAAGQLGPPPSNPAKQILTTSLRNFLQRHDWPQILHLQEVKINPDDEETKRKVQHAVNYCRSGPDDGPHYTVHFCLPRDQYNATGFGKKVFGVATIIRDDFMLSHVQTVRETDWDVEGRVLVVETYSRLSIWNLYGVNGTGNVYRDPQTGAVAGTRNDRKLAFHKSMFDECRRLEQAGYRLVLAGDFNITRESIDAYPKLREKPDQHMLNRKDFVDKFYEDANGLRLVDTFRHLHPKKKKYTWLPRNKEWRSCCDRLDLVLVSRSLVEEELGLHEADVLMTELDRGPSDHVPVSVTLSMPPAYDLFGGDALFDETFDQIF